MYRVYGLEVANINNSYKSEMVDSRILNEMCVKYAQADLLNRGWSLVMVLELHFEE